jgi:probable HAF family extracellular repeat protein
LLAITGFLLEHSHAADGVCEIERRRVGMRAVEREGLVIAGRGQIGAACIVMHVPQVADGSMFTGLDPLLPPNTSAQATGVNNAGLISGFFVDTGGVNHGFLLNGTTETTLDAPGSTFTQALGLNNKGQMVGFYLDATGNMHGFVYSGGSYNTVDDPNGVGTTIINGINDLGQLVGFYVDANGNTDGLVATPTPEPSGLLLLGSGVLGLAGTVRRKFKR